MSEALLQLGLHRETVVIVQIFLDTLTIARHSDLVALVPRICLRDGQSAGHSLAGFNVPVTTPDLTIIVMWRPRLDADSAHRLLRETVVAICNAEHATPDVSVREEWQLSHHRK